MPTQLLISLILSFTLRHLSTFMLRFAKAHGEAVRDAAVAFGIALVVSALICFLPPLSLTTALTDDFDRFFNDIVVPLRRFELSLHHITIALRPGPNSPDSSIRVDPTPVAVYAVTPLSPLLWLLERLAVLPHEPARFLASLVAGSTVAVPLLGPNILVSLLTTCTANEYLRQIGMVLEVPVFLTSAALLYLQTAVVMLVFPIAADLCRERDPGERMEMFRERVKAAPVVWSFDSNRRRWDYRSWGWL